MNLTIHGVNVAINEQLEEFAQKKLGKLDRYLPNISEVRLELSRTPAKRGEDLTIAQITLRHERGAILRAEEKLRGTDRDAMKKAITVASEKMYRQIERFKGKRRDSRRRKGQQERYFATDEEIATAEPVPTFEAIAAEYEEDFDEAETIVRRKEVELAPMTEEEAVEQMELLGHKFFMFMNGKTGNVNVVYLRDGGGYGVLAPRHPS
jgi:putative sigma-54 modulation protein